MSYFESINEFSVPELFIKGIKYFAEKSSKNGDMRIVNAIKSLPKFKNSIFVDPNRFRRYYGIHSPKFEKICMDEIDKTSNVMYQKEFPGDRGKIRNDLKYTKSFDSISFYPYSEKIIKSGWSSAILHNKRKDCGFFFKFNDGIIEDIYVIRYKKVGGKYDFYPYRLKCSDTISPSLYKA